MGVHGLWELLAPVGRRVSVETLSNKKLAIDASIWIVQFLKAMRDDRGEVLRNAHLLGFFRRICKLLYLRVKPVFVFDGGTPFLKRRTVIARRRQREQAQAKIRKTAEKLLLNHLKARKLEELVREEEERGLPEQQNGATLETQSQDRRDNEGETNNGTDDGNKPQEDADALLAASLQQKEWDDGSDAPIDMQAGENDDSGDEHILPVAQGKIDPAVLGALPPSMQLRLLDQMREQLVAENRQKFAKVAKAPASFSEMQIEAYLKTVAFRREIVEVQKAAGNKGIGGVPSTRIASEVNREFIFTSSQQDDKHKETNSTVFTSQVVQVPPVEQENKETSGEVQTYIDDRGRKRVSRIRGMGVRMTRDLQWNLYLMKDKEKNCQLAEELNEAEDDAYLAALDEQSLDETGGELGKDGGPGSDIEILEQAPQEAPMEHSGIEDTEIEWEEGDGLSGPAERLPADITGMEFTLENDGSADPDDEVFKSLVASAPPEEETGEEEDIEWEEGIISTQPAPCPATTTQGTPQRQEATDLGWSEQLHETEKRISEEEQQLEEAIRRSVLDFGPRRAYKPLKMQDSVEAWQKDEDRTVFEAGKMERERARKGKALLTVETTEKEKIQELPLSPQDTRDSEASTDDCRRGNASTDDSRRRLEVTPDAVMEEGVKARRLAELEEAKERLLEEESQLRTEQKNNERNADSVSSEMFSECQELLQLFGLPYVVSPMEAEAQCAFMDSADLVDGVITDDSDVFLFGARSVYKNIFDGHKYVETYFMKDVEADLGLNQDKLIRMAMLLGSDYTEGISGIGIVNAIEVVNAFPEEDGLTKLREWIDSPDLMLLDKLNNKASKPHAQQRPGDEVDEKKYRFMQKHRAVSKNWTVPPSFPSRTVIEAYSSPQVDRSTETFSWGRPDLDCLRKFCFEKFSWTKEKADELLLPVLKEYDRRETQLRLDAFYTFNERFAKIRSRRIQKAVTGITGRRVTEIMDASADVDPPTKKKRQRKNSESAQNNSIPKKKEAGAKRQKKTSTATGTPGKRSRARKEVNHAPEEAAQDTTQEPKDAQPELASMNEERQEAETPSLQEHVMDGNVNTVLAGGFIPDDDGGDPVEAASEATNSCTAAKGKLDANEEGETRLLAMPFFRRKRRS